MHDACYQRPVNIVEFVHVLPGATCHFHVYTPFLRILLLLNTSTYHLPPGIPHRRFIFLLVLFLCTITKTYSDLLIPTFISLSSILLLLYTSTLFTILVCLFLECYILLKASIRHLKTSSEKFNPTLISRIFCYQHSLSWPRDLVHMRQRWCIAEQKDEN